MSWQPIETAPKDRTSVLVYGYWDGELHIKDKKRNVWRAHFNYGEWYVEGGEYYCQKVVNPTHWMPLPAPPKKEDGA